MLQFLFCIDRHSQFDNVVAYTRNQFNRTIFLNIELNDLAIPKLIVLLNTSDGGQVFFSIPCGNRSCCHYYISR